jgi:hypothetical protein
MSLQLKLHLNGHVILMGYRTIIFIAKTSSISYDLKTLSDVFIAVKWISNISNPFSNNSLASDCIKILLIASADNKLFLLAGWTRL